MSSSETEASDNEKEFSRLGDCEVCDANKAIYTCPKCEVKTCSLHCVRIHKNELECDGVRDRTKFIRMKDFTNTDLLSDYRLLEECARFVWGVKRDEKKKFTRIDKELPIHLFKLKMAARKRGTVLQFLAQNFTRHKINTTRYNYKTKIINWRVEWVFPNTDMEPLKFVDEKCSEQAPLIDLLDKYLNPDIMGFDKAKALMFYKAAGFSGVKILLKVKDSASKFFELDAAETLAENLSGKCIVEFPIIFVVLKDHAYNFDIINPEDEFDQESEKNTESTKQTVFNAQPTMNVNESTTQNAHKSNDGNNQQKRPRILLTEKIFREKKMALEKEVKAERKKRPRNLLFTTGYSSEESLEDNESDKDDK